MAALVELAAKEDASTRSGCFEVQSLMKTCGTKCFSSSNQAGCASTCLAQNGVTTGCANCFGRKISCTVKNCLSGCAADPNGAACKTCVASKCLAWKIISGIAPATLFCYV